MIRAKALGDDETSPDKPKQRQPQHEAHTIEQGKRTPKKKGEGKGKGKGKGQDQPKNQKRQPKKQQPPQVKTQDKQLCVKFFQHGNCPRGDKCNFAHLTVDQYVEHKRATTRAAQKNRALEGNDDHKHDDASKAQYDLKPCYNWEKGNGGNCRFGDNCRFSHSKPVSSLSTEQHVSETEVENRAQVSQVDQHVRDVVTQESEVFMSETSAAKRAETSQTKETQEMNEIKALFPLGATVEIDWPNAPPLHGERGLVHDHRPHGRVLISPYKSDMSPEDLRLCRVTGLVRNCLVRIVSHILPLRAQVQEVNLSATDRSYSFRAISDSGATGPAFVNTVRMCVPGTVKRMANPVIVKSPWSAENFSAKYSGTVIIRSNTGSDDVIVLYDCPITEGSSRSLISVAHLDDKGYYCDLGGGGMRVRYGGEGQAILALPRLEESGGKLVQLYESPEIPTHGPIDFDLPVGSRGRLYPIPDELFVTSKEEADEYLNKVAECANTEEKKSDVVVGPEIETFPCGEACYSSQYSSLNYEETLHVIYNHCMAERSLRMEEWDTGKPIPKKKRKAFCMHCLIGASHDASWAKIAAPKNLSLLSHVAVDLKVGLPTSVHGFTCYMVIYEYWSEYMDMYLLRRRSEAKGKLTFWMRNQMNRFPGLRIQALYLDGGELRAESVEMLCAQMGTQIHCNLANEHQGNPRAEARIKMVSNSSKKALSAGHAPPHAWEFSTTVVVNTYNVMPSMKELKAPLLLKDGSCAERPRTPKEKFLQVDLGSYKEQRKFIVPAFTLGVAHVNKDQRQAKDMPGFQAMYCCPVTDGHVKSTTGVVKKKAAMWF